jgi:hypothetical protein
LRRPAHYYFFIIFYPRKAHFFILEPPANYFLFFIFIDPVIIPIPHFYFRRSCRRSARRPAHYYFSLFFLPGKRYFFILELSANYFSLSLFDPLFLSRRPSPSLIFIFIQPSDGHPQHTFLFPPSPPASRPEACALCFFHYFFIIFYPGKAHFLFREPSGDYFSFLLIDPLLWEPVYFGGTLAFFGRS